MTLAVDDRLGPPVFQRSATHGPTRRAGRWRFAARLARREVRRRPGRTFLVMLLVAVPVFGMTVITVLVRTDNDSAAEIWAREFGHADLVTIGGRGNPTLKPPAQSRSIEGSIISSIGL